MGLPLPGLVSKPFDCIPPMTFGLYCDESPPRRSSPHPHSSSLTSCHPATPEDIYGAAKAPVDQGRNLIATYAEAVQKAYEARVSAPAKELYDARVAPVYDSASAQFQELKAQNAYLARATEVVENLQTNLSKT